MTKFFAILGLVVVWCLLVFVNGALNSVAAAVSVI